MNHSDRQKIKRILSDRYWRLNHLYRIVDKNNRLVVFRMNEAQRYLYNNRWYRNVILKSRQLGFTTLIDILLLDACLFTPNFEAGIIAHNKDDAKDIFRRKIKTPYENLPKWLTNEISAEVGRSGEYVFSNGSSIRVATSMRSGTPKGLHISEFGKIAAKYPEKSREIKTGAIEAVPMSGVVFVESTAEGVSGDFHDMVMTARRQQDEGRELSALDYKFFFFPWYLDRGNVVDPKLVPLTNGVRRYFDKLKKDGLEYQFSDAQKSWYQAKLLKLGDDMRRENPTTPDEAFEASVKGAYYSEVMAKLRRDGRLTSVPVESGFPVHTFWDLGMDDSMAIWFFQQVGRENRLIDYVEASGEGFPYYARLLREKGYLYGTHYMPHDIAVRELGTGKARKIEAERLGIKPIIAVPRARNQAELLADIDKVRTFLQTVWIDSEKCADGVKCLDGYRKKFDKKHGIFTGTPEHDEAVHGADALRTGAVYFIGEQRKKSKRHRRKNMPSAVGWT